MTGLTNGVTYIFQLRAWASNAGGRVGGLLSEERTATPMAPPELTFGLTTYSGGEGSGTISVTVNASFAPTSALTVNLTTTNGTATGGTDFTAPQATFTFPASMTSHSISVAITQDTTVESDETFTLTAGSGYTVGSPASTTVTITNDDTAPPPVSGTRGLALTPSELYVVEGGNATFSVRLTARPTSAVTVTVRSPNSEVLLSSGAEGETPAQTLTLNFVLSKWDVPLPVVVSGVADAVADGVRRRLWRGDRVGGCDGDRPAVDAGVGFREVHCP